MQLEELILGCQVFVAIRSPNVEDGLVRLLIEGDVEHVRTSRFDYFTQVDYH